MKIPFLLSVPLLVAPLIVAQSQKVPQSQAGAGLTHLQKEVRHELVMLPNINIFDNLAFRVDGNTVTLMGQVTEPVKKSDAENVVKHIEGVGQVDNQIEVLPLSPNDDQIRRATYLTLVRQPQLQRYFMQAVPPIRIIVKNGNVSLEGVVANKVDSDFAKITANGVPGVFSVTDSLRVEK
jgi:hyperosmotically inducible periplasmic protein